jgi:hypothetical protein
MPLRPTVADTTDRNEFPRQINASGTRYLMLSEILRRAVTTASEHAGSEARIGRISIPSRWLGPRNDIADVLVKEWNMDEWDEARPTVQSSYGIAAFTFPENHCFQPPLTQGREWHIMVVEVQFGEVTITVLEFEEGCPICTAYETVHGTGQEFSQAVSEVAATVTGENQSISSVVLAGEVSDALAQELKLAISSAVPSLTDKIKDPATSFQQVAVVGAACTAQERVLHEAHHNEL